MDLGSVFIRSSPGQVVDAEKRDKLASFQLIGLHWSPARQGLLAGYRTGDGAAPPR
jgi:hypothetical protein